MNDLDEVCMRCAGTGETERDESCCAHCQGYGYHLTAKGSSLIEFLKRRGVGFPMSPQAEEELRRIIE